jgi:sugar phosphate isomerase/epimerase
MRPCVSQATTLTTPFTEDVDAYADGGCRAVEVWLTKLEEHLKSHPAAETRKRLEDREVTLAAASYQGGLLLSEGEARRAHLDHFKRRLDLCQFFRIGTLLIAPDFVDKVGPSALPRAVAALAEAARWAEAFGVRLALEPQGRSNWCACLDTAAALVAACGQSNVGVALDLFHYYTGPSKFDDLALLTPANLAFVQVCDLAGVPRELATDADRILPGEGDFDLVPILKQLRAAGYDGWVSLELLNPALWQARASQVAELGLEAVRRLLQAADVGTVKAGGATKV